MNNKLQLLIAFSLAIILTFSIASFADDGPTRYYGTIEGAEEKLAEFYDVEDTQDKEKAIEATNAYLLTVNPEIDGYGALVAKIDKAELTFAKILLDELKEQKTTESRHERLLVLNTFYINHPIAEDIVLEDSGYTCAMIDADIKSNTLSIADEYLSASVGSSDKLVKNDKLTSLTALIDELKPTLSTDFCTRQMEENLACLELYFNAIDDSDILSFGTTLRQAKSFLRYHAFDVESQRYLEICASLAEINSEYNIAYESARAALELEGWADDFAYQPQVFLSFDDVTLEKGKIVEEGHTDSLGNIITRIGIESGNDGDNFYYTTHYDMAQHIRPNIYFTPFSRSAVLEVDITTFGKLPMGGLAIHDLGVFDTERWYCNYLYISENGDILSGKDKRVLVAGALSRGEWTHFSFVVDLDTADVKIYVDYEYLETINCAHSTKGYSYSPHMLRISGSPGKAGGEFSIDNLFAYEGYAPRDITRYSMMEKSELFAFYVAQASNSSALSAWRYDYLEAARELLPYVKDNSDMAEVLAAFESIDGDKLLAETREYNLQGFENRINQLLSIGHSESTYNARSMQISKIETYLTRCMGLIESGEKYDELYRIYLDEQEILKTEDVLTTFVAYVREFDLALSVQNLLKYRALAQSTIDGVQIDFFLNESAYPSFVNAYNRLAEMDAIIYENTVIENSERIVASILFIEDYCKPELWEENYDSLKFYVFTVLDIVDSGLYDGYFRSINEKLDEYSAMFKFFKEKRQNDYVSRLAELVEEYDSVDTYFKRYLACIRFNAILEEDSIDLEDERIIALKAQNDSNYANLIADEEAYEELLLENTARFIDRCSALVGTVSYTTMKTYLEEAAVYYFSMDVEDAAVRDAIEIFFARMNEVDRIEALALEFTDKVLLLNSATSDSEFLASIIDCHKYVDVVAHDAPGVAQALEALEAKSSDYNSKVLTVNLELGAVNPIGAYLANNSARKSIITLALVGIAK